MSQRDAVTCDRIDLLGSTIDRAAVTASWEESLAAPLWPGPPVWLHGDLHPHNLIVRDGVLAAVIDFGDICGGDPASDVAAAWMSLPNAAHATFRAAAGNPDDDTWLRARVGVVSCPCGVAQRRR